jgi:prophage maintenance system killer protein
LAAWYHATVQYLGAGDFFLIAERTLTQTRGPEGHSAEELADVIEHWRLFSTLLAPRAEFNGVELYPSLPAKAAVLCARICRNRPLPYGNAMVALAAMREMIARNDASWTPPPGGDQEVVDVIEALAAGRISEADFAAWVGERLR